MAYQTGLASRELAKADLTIASVKSGCAAVSTAAAAGNIPSATILNLFVKLKQDRATLIAAREVNGILEMARLEKNLPAMDVRADFDDVVAGIADVTAWIEANFPKGGPGSIYLLAQTLGPSSPVDRTFTPAETATFRTVLDALVARII